MVAVTAGASLTALIAALVFFGQPLFWIYDTEYAPVSAMARLLSVAAVMVGFGDFFNRFLGAHGKGNILRNAAYFVGGVNVLGFFLLVPIWGVWGVIAIAIASGITYFGFIYYYYLQYTALNKTPHINKDAEKSGKAQPPSSECLACRGKVIILLDSFGFPNGMASSQRVRYIANLLVQSKFHVKVLCVRALEKGPAVINAHAKGVSNGIPYEYTPGTTIRSNRFLYRRYYDIKGILVALVRLAKFRAMHQVDCIYYYGTIMHNTINRWIFYLAAWLLGIPLVTDVSEPPWLLIEPRRWHTGFLSPIFGVNGVILISTFLKDWVTGEALNRHKPISILYLPALIDVNENQVTTAKLNSDMTVLLAGANRKTVDFVLQSMQWVWQKYPNCKLIITGVDMVNLDTYQQCVYVENGFTPGHVEFVGYVPRCTLLDLYQSASALLIPLFNDVRSQARFPTKLVEYLYSGTPVVTCRVGEADYYLVDSKTAFLADPESPEKYAKKILEAIAPENYAIARLVGHCGQRLAEDRFDIRHYREATATFFSGICRQ